MVSLFFGMGTMGVELYGFSCSIFVSYRFVHSRFHILNLLWWYSFCSGWGYNVNGLYAYLRYGSRAKESFPGCADRSTTPVVINCPGAVRTDNDNSIELFEKPFVCYNGDNGLFKELTRIMSSLGHLLTQKQTEMKSRLIRDEASHGISQVDVENCEISGGDKCKGVDMNVHGPPKTNTELFTILLVSLDYHFQFEKKYLPLPGFACVLQILSGYYFVVLASVQDFVSEEYGIDDLGKYFDKGGDKIASWRNKLPKFGLPRGSSLYVPFGYVPLFISVGNPNEAQSSFHMEDYGSILIHYMTIDPPVTYPTFFASEIRRTTESALGRNLKSLRGGQTAIKSWVKRNTPEDAE